MARYVSATQLENVRKLIKKVTSLKQGEENFRRCESFSLSMIYNHNYLDPHAGDVQKAMNGMIEKLVLHAHYDRAGTLKEAFEKLINDEGISGDRREVLWKVLHFLILMSNTPAIDQPIKMHQSVHENKEESSTAFDWGAYLMEGVEIDAFGPDSSDESVWSLSEDGDEEDLSKDIDGTLADLASADYLSDATSEAEASSPGPPHVESPDEPDQWLDRINESWRATESGYRHPAPPPNPQFPAANLIDFWLDHSSKDGVVPSIRVLSEYMVLRELLWALRCPQACGLVFSPGPDHTFSVAPDVAVCSLTPAALQAALSEFCPLLSMLSEMQAFTSDLMPAANVTLQPPSTYKAYACALHVISSQQNAFLLELEKRVMAQDDINTIQSVTAKLQPWIRFQMALYSVHKKAVEDWKIQDPWICATKLLSVLGMLLALECDPQMAAVLLSLLLRSLQPYLDMTEEWLKTGTLQDPVQEFIITKEDADSVDSSCVLEGNFALQPYVTALRGLGVEPLPLLEPLAEHGLVVGRSIQLLQGLRSMDTVPQAEGQESLYSELVATVRSQLLPSSCVVENQEEPDVQEVAGDTWVPPPSPMDPYMQDYLLSCNDPYMLMAFGDVLDLGLEVSHPHEHFQLPKEKLLFREGEVSTMQPLAPLLRSSLSLLLSRRAQGVGRVAGSLLHDRCRLGAHLAALRGVALLDEGVAMHQFFSYLVDQVLVQEDWPRWASWYLLTNQLQACISQRRLDWSHLFSVSTSRERTTDKTSEITEGFPLMQLLDHLELQYKMEWPITLVLRDENMQLYNKVFRFLAKLKCALISLQQLRLQDLQCEETLRMSALRAWLLFLLGSLQEHLLGHLLTTLTHRLNEQLAGAKDLHTALAAHDEFVRKAFTYCLMDEKAIAAHNQILEVVALAMSVSDWWRRGGISAQQVSGFEQDYGKLHTFLGYLFSHLTRFGANLHLTGVAAALGNSVPPY